MKDKLIKTITVAVVTLISSALVAYLKNPENRLAIRKYAKQQYQAKFQKTAKKVKKAVEKKVKEYKV
jgi:hypothetical protein